MRVFDFGNILENRTMQPGCGPTQGVLEKAEGVLDVKAPQIGAPASLEIRFAGPGPKEPQHLLCLGGGLGQVLDLDADDGATNWARSRTLRVRNARPRAGNGCTHDLRLSDEPTVVTVVSPDGGSAFDAGHCSSTLTHDNRYVKMIARIRSDIWKL
jgi:hypothetical protein